MVFSDSHAHLSFVAERLGPAALAEILSRFDEAWAEGARPFLIDAGVDADDLVGRRACAGNRPYLGYAAGAFPSAEALADPGASIARLEKSLEREAASGFRPVAIGECGLDYHHRYAPAPVQAELFSGQIGLARRLGLPLIVHTRDAAADTLALLKSEGPGHPTLIHCFSYGPAEAEAFLDAGCFLSFAGNLSYKSAQSLREALVLVPEDRLLLETDSPYLNPEPRRGRPATPLDVERSYRLAAELRGSSLEDLAARVSMNGRTFFRLDRPSLSSRS